MLIVSTASPYKFSGDVLVSLTGKKPEDDLDAPDMLEKLTGVGMPEPLRRVLSREPRHTEVIDKREMKEAVRKFAVGDKRS